MADQLLRLAWTRRQRHPHPCLYLIIVCHLSSLDNWKDLSLEIETQRRIRTFSWSINIKKQSLIQSLLKMLHVMIQMKTIESSYTLSINLRIHYSRWKRFLRIEIAWLGVINVLWNIKTWKRLLSNGIEKTVSKIVHRLSSIYFCDKSNSLHLLLSHWIWKQEK